jgi:hypothetical protein
MKTNFNIKNALAAIAVLVSAASTTAYASSLRSEAMSVSGGFGDTSYASKGSDLSFEAQHLYLSAPAAAAVGKGETLGHSISATIQNPVPDNTSTIALLAMSCFLGLFFKKR